MKTDSRLVKYPRTFNFPWSGSDSSDDVWWEDSSFFDGKQVVVTEKLDGECANLYRDYFHARSLDGHHHPSQAWMKKFHAEFRHNIPRDYRICGENVYAYHSIFYTDLPTYFMVFGIYDHQNHCLSWEETEEYCKLLNLHTVPVIYRGVWDEKKIRALWKGKGAFPTFASTKDNPVFPEDFTPTQAEGYVVRLEEKFHHQDFRYCCAKFVRENHVTSKNNWRTRAVIPNLMKEEVQ